MRLPHTQLKNKHRGEDAYIICSGASLDFYDKSFFDNKLTIGVNRVCKFLKCQYNVHKDERGFVEAVKYLDESPTLIISKHQFGSLPLPENKLDIEEDYYYFTHSQNPNLRGIKINPRTVGNDKIIVSRSTITSAIHIGAYMGAKNIILVAHDCGTINGKINASGYSEIIKPLEGDDKYETFVKSEIENDTIVLREWVKAHYGCNVISLNPFINFGLEGNKYER